MAEPTLRVLMSTPAYWPAVEFGGPIWTARELAEGLVRRGHRVDVLTTSLVSLERPPARRLRTERREVGGAAVHYLATPLRYRWMGVAPTAPLVLRRMPRCDVAHVGGFRDPLGTAVALWCRAARIPYVFEPLGMFRAKWRKVRLKRLLDATLVRHVADGAAAVVAVSEAERDEIVAAGVAADRVVVRGNGFPAPLDEPPGPGLRAALGLPPGVRVVLFVGRLAAGKGIPLLLDAARSLGDAHVVLAGPDAGDGTRAHIAAAARSPELAGRVHVLPPSVGERPLELYAGADAVVLPSLGESFGMVAAEAAAAGTPAVVTEGCGIAPLVRDRSALVVPHDAAALRDAIARLLADEALRARLAEGGRRLAREQSWDAVVARQERIYRDAVSA